MFPQIKTINDLLPHIERNKQIRVKVESTGHTVVCYMVQDEDTFSGTDLQYAIECRGITFHPDGKIAARTMEKFFNIGEHDLVQHWALDWSKVTRVMEKRDGSMVTPVGTTAGRFKFKTKKSFDTPEAALADSLVHSDPNRVKFVQNLIAAGLTPTFEITSPRFPIVIKYEKDELTLLHIRENVTGRYLTEKEIGFLNPPFPIVKNQIEEFTGVDFVAWDYLRHAAETREGIEGWVIQFEDGRMVKLKTQWYCDLHHSVTFTRWRDIARTVVADKSDDLKGAFVMTGRDIEPILKVERLIKHRLESVQRLVDAAVRHGREKDMDAKAMALMFKEHSLFGLIMKTFRGSEINWMDWYAKNHLDNDWSLEVVEVNV